MDVKRKKMKDAIRSYILGSGADVCGFAGIERFEKAPAGFHPLDIFEACKTVIVFGVSLPLGLFQVAPRLIYGHYNDASCAYVDKIAFLAAKEMERLSGGSAVPMPSDAPYEFWDQDKMEGRGLISMKHAAVLAGLGSLGKNTLLVNEQYGNRLTLGAILTDCELSSDPLVRSVCLQNCQLCIKSCPVQALGEGKVQQELCRMHAYGKNARGFDTVDCNKCRAVCPMRFGRMPHPSISKDREG
jgi:epoxyqueuosine reductase